MRRRVGKVSALGGFERSLAPLAILTLLLGRGRTAAELGLRGTCRIEVSSLWSSRHSYLVACRGPGEGALTVLAPCKFEIDRCVLALN